MLDQAQVAAAGGKHKAVIRVLTDESLSSSVRTKYARRIDRYSNGLPIQF
ncbi:MAG: hypothetical protein HON77_22470 [Gammaproteobacteria bacterium]|jgi:hypothetical protein|nr:hypothetical protein [Gammaproteobacteria bacterium]